MDEYARQIRLDSLAMIHRAKSGHPGGSLSSAEILTVLIFHQMRLDPARPEWLERDRLILSKGHAVPALYAALARRGFFPVSMLNTFRQFGSCLSGHPDRLKTPGIEMSSGVLGHGVPIGTGLALALRMAKLPSRVYVLLGDGECQAGLTWEGTMAAAKYRLANLTVIVDYNGIQLDGWIHEIMPLEPFADKWQAHNWFVLDIDGHDIHQIIESFHQAENIHDRPTVIIARTIKGKGVSFMENQSSWHGKAPNDDEYSLAVNELTGWVE